jgi:hypothetical protein
MIKIALSVIIVVALAYYGTQLLIKLERKQLKPIFMFLAALAFSAITLTTAYILF